ncbi:MULTISPECIES: cytochrome c [unclassified Pseudomonas]|uniref:c-type cytochrome n=1 Tax=unclassified Pseudomonas TaxID=196821 RepID=UPI000A1E474C|nr:MULTISPECIES: cytochrome c [unclassified Pseudomonas]
MKNRTLFIALLGLCTATHAQHSLAENINGKKLYLQRCSVCHGTDIKGTGPLARKSNPPTPDLTTLSFRKRLADYPGVIVSSIVLRPNGSLIPDTLKENNVKIPPHAWSVQDLRDVNQYMSSLISKAQ